MFLGPKTGYLQQNWENLKFWPPPVNVWDLFLIKKFRWWASLFDWFKGDTSDRTPQVSFYDSFLIGAIGMSLWDESMIFCSGKSWNVGFNHEKVFYPLQKFFTPFLGTWC